MLLAVLLPIATVFIVMGIYAKVFPAADSNKHRQLQAQAAGGGPKPNTKPAVKGP